MTKPESPQKTSRRWLHRGRWLALAVVVLAGSYWLSAGEEKKADDLLTQMRQIPSSTFSDAVDQIVGKRGYMNFDMRPLVPKGRMVGRAKTALYGPGVTNSKVEAKLSSMHGVQLIDESGPGDVLVLVTNDPNITGIGGLMATTSKVRGIEGVVVDGAARDIDQIEELGLPVFCRSVSPSTSVGRLNNLARDVPVICGGVRVNPGDYICGDRDGVVCIPAEHILPVLKLSQDIEEREKKMIPKIHELKSLQKVIEIFKRI